MFTKAKDGSNKDPQHCQEWEKNVQIHCTVNLWARFILTRDKPIPTLTAVSILTSFWGKKYLFVQSAVAHCFHTFVDRVFPVRVYNFDLRMTGFAVTPFRFGELSKFIGKKLLGGATCRVGAVLVAVR